MKSYELEAIANSMRAAMINSGGTMASDTELNLGLPAIKNHVSANAGFDIVSPFGAIRVIICDLGDEG